MSNSKKSILITGGSRGIGLATIQRFKKEGWQVATCATQKRSLDGSPADLATVCDVSSADDVKKTVQAVVKQFGKIDALVNNAGLAGEDPLDAESSDEVWHRIIDVNLHGPYYMCKFAAPYIPDKTGRIVNLGSVLSLKGVPDHVAYCAAKHGVLGFTRAYAHFMAKRKITVNAVCPGWVKTDMALNRIKEIGANLEDIGKGVPLGRIVEPQEVADLIYFLCASEGSAMITGQALTIDGGFLA